MDILSNLTSLLGGAGGQQQQSQASSGLGGALGGLGSLVGALLGGGGGGQSSAMGASGAAGLGGIGSLIGSLMGGQGGGMLSQLLGGEQPPPAPQARSANIDQARAVNTLRALVYAAKADGKLDAQEKQTLSAEIQKSGLSSEGQQLVNQFLGEDVNPAAIAQNITSSQEALQIYALSCAITRMDSFMERSYLDNLAQALGIPPQTKTAIEQKIGQ